MVRKINVVDLNEIQSVNTQEATHTEKTPSPIEETPPEAEHPEPEVPKVETVIEVSPKSEPKKHR